MVLKTAIATLLLMAVPAEAASRGNRKAAAPEAKGGPRGRKPGPKKGAQPADAIDDDGYLREPLEAIVEALEPETSCTVEEVQAAYLYSWRKGIKANALYRDGSKLSQPLSTALLLPMK